MPTVYFKNTNLQKFGTHKFLNGCVFMKFRQGERDGNTFFNVILLYVMIHMLWYVMVCYDVLGYAIICSGLLCQIN